MTHRNITRRGFILCATAPAFSALKPAAAYGRDGSSAAGVAGSDHGNHV